MMRKLTNCRFIGAAVIAMSSPPNIYDAIGDEYRYAVIQVPGLGGHADRGQAINDLGHVVGSSFVPDGAFHPFLWNGRDTIDLGTFGGLDGHAGIAYDINNYGVVVGYAEDGVLAERPFRYDNGVMTDLGERMLTRGNARSINDAGWIAGSGRYPDRPGTRPIVWIGSQIVELPALTEAGGEVRSITESGVMGGFVEHENGFGEAAAWIEGNLFQLGGFLENDRRGIVLAINDLNIAVGSARGVPAEVSWRAAVWDETGTIHNLSKIANSVGGYLPYANAINNSNEIVGPFRSRKDDELHGFIYTVEHGAEALDRLIPPFSGWSIDFASDINNHGQITGYGVPDHDPEKGDRAFLLTPVEPEITLQSADGPLRADAINILRITSARPNATIKFFYGKRGGGKRIPGCDALAAMLQIDDPVLFGEAIADADGNAQLDIFIPARAASHKGFLIQAVDFQNCEESQLVLKKVE